MQVVATSMGVSPSFLLDLETGVTTPMTTVYVSPTTTSCPAAASYSVAANSGFVLAVVPDAFPALTITSVTATYPDGSTAELYAGNGLVWRSTDAQGPKVNVLDTPQGATGTQSGYLVAYAAADCGSPTPTPTPTPGVTATPTGTPPATPTPTPTAPPAETPSPTPTPTAPAPGTPTSTPTAPPIYTPTPTPTSTPTSTPTVTPTPTPAGQGCTPGYWKAEQHFDSWPAPYIPTGANATRFSVAFGRVLPGYPGNLTLLQAVKLGGGQYQALGRHATAALLNATTSSINYGMTPAQVITLVQAAIDSGNLTTVEATKDQLSMLNERGCPLN
jgi:hypothetical protein